MSTRHLARVLKKEQENAIPVEDSEEESTLSNFNPFDALSPDEIEKIDVLDTIEIDSRSRKQKNRKQKKNIQQPVIATKIVHEEAKKDDNIVHPKYFDIEMEIKRIFGSSVLDKVPIHQRMPNLKYRIKSTLLPHLARSPPMWMINPNNQIRITMLMKQNKVFSFSHSKEYQQTETDFFSAVESFDPEAIQQILSMHQPPSHINSLLAMSDIYRHSGHYQQASECVEMTLFIMEQAFHPSFCILEHKLDYNCYENRALFLAIFRHIDHIGRKGCWKSSFEFCKLLFQLDSSDPLGVLYMIDFYALQARQYDFILSDTFDKMMNTLNVLPPQFYYSKAIACINLDNSLGAEYLKIGIQEHPLVLLWICKDKGISPLPCDMNVTGSSLVARLYVERCHTIWKQQKHAQWLQETLKSMFKDNEQLLFESSEIDDIRLYRHVYLLDDHSIPLPSSCKLLQGNRSRYQLQRHDPFPPQDTITNSLLYDSYFQELHELYRAPGRGLFESTIDALQRLLSFSNT